MINRIAMLSVHTSPLATLGGKETGGMNVYVRDLTQALSRRGLDVDVYTRSQDPALARIQPLGERGRVIQVKAGPHRPYNKNLIFNHLAEFACGNNIDLTIPGPEAVLVAGVVDIFRARNLKIFGPDSRAAALEGSKALFNDLLGKILLPWPWLKIRFRILPS